MKPGDILTKVKDTGGFRKIGSQIEIIEIKETYINVLHLPKNETALLGDDTDYYGKSFVESNYSLTS